MSWNSNKLPLILLAVVVVISAVILIFGPRFDNDQNGCLVTHSTMVIADSCLNADILQITGRIFRSDALKEDMEDALWLARAGNRMMLLQQRKVRYRSDIGPGWHSYYHKILGVFVSKEDPGDGEEVTFHFIMLKDNKELRQAIPALLQQDYPNFDFKW